VAAVWNCILNTPTGGLWLANRIRDFEFVDENVRIEIQRPNLQWNELAFQTLLRNRVNRGGILAAGAGQIRQGENGEGLRSRWYPETLYTRIMAIVGFKNRIRFMTADGFDFLRSKARVPNAAFFIDPPYTSGRKSAGTRLYDDTECELDELFEIVDDLEGSFLLTYADCVPVRRLAEEFHFEVESVRMKTTHHQRKNELLISRDLSWFRAALPR
jgi:DNA adenine methylase